MFVDVLVFDHSCCSFLNLNHEVYALFVIYECVRGNEQVKANKRQRKEEDNNKTVVCCGIQNLNTSNCRAIQRNKKRNNGIIGLNYEENEYRLDCVCSTETYCKNKEEELEMKIKTSVLCGRLV